MPSKMPYNPNDTFSLTIITAGPPGSGKSRLVKAISDFIQEHEDFELEDALVERGNQHENLLAHVRLKNNT